MIKTRFSFRRWVAALTLGLTVPVLAGCGVGRHVADSGGAKFWRRGEAQPTAVARADADEKKDSTGRVTIDDLGAKEPKVEVVDAVEGTDPFLDTDTTVAEKPIRPAAARETAPEPARKPVAVKQTAPAFDPVAEQLAQLKRDAAAEQNAPAEKPAAEGPSMEWADDLPAATEKVVRRAAQPQPAPAPKAQPRPKPANPADVIAEVVDKPAAEPTPNVEDIVAAPKERTPGVAVQDPSMIVDTIEIRPRTVHDPKITKTSAASREGLRREVEAAGETRDALWSFGEEDAEEEATTTIPTTDEATGDESAAIEAGYDAAAEPIETVPAETSDDVVETNPLLLLPPSTSAEAADEEPELYAELAIPPISPAAPESAPAPEKSIDRFPFDPDPEVVTALDSLDFEKDPEPSATPATSTLGWWFAGIGLVAVGVIWRARKFFS